MKLHRNNSGGFTLIEVVLAVAIVGVIMTAVFVAQGSAMYAVNRISQVLRRVYAAEQYMLEKRAENVNGVEVKSDQKIITYPAATLAYKLEKTDNPSLKAFKDIYREEVVISWKEQRVPRTDALVSFSFKPPRPE